MRGVIVALAALLGVATSSGCLHAPTDATAASPAIYRGTKGFTNHYLLVGERVVVVDSGNHGRTRMIARELKRIGRTPEDVSLVVLTHAHADHAGSASELQRRFGVPIAVGLGDLPTAVEGHNPPLLPTSKLGKRLRPFIRNKYPPVVPDLVVRDTLDLSPYGIAGTIVLTGGHTPGSLAVLLGSGEVVSGDLVRGGFTKHHHPELHFFQDDLAAAHAALAGLLERGARVFHPGHGGPLAATDVASYLRAHPAAH
jgi:hydroxyacylglutathione hydrolase